MTEKRTNKEHYPSIALTDIHNDSNPQLLRIADVLKIVPIGKSTWWLWVANKTAPQPIRLGRCTFWRYSDVIALIERGEK
ncbi:MAG: AlpA family phage regulatory protein [Anaerolineaceae bacterium]|nr:AlpA family phage regulatory protein [Anaerolineaceae bacterium]